ncbi:uncharacterized protein ACNLHF_021410 [Anomaloglossus baeobatrachus]
MVKQRQANLRVGSLNVKGLHSPEKRSILLNLLWRNRIQVAIMNSLSGDLLCKRIFLIELLRMGRNKDKMAERILHLTLEILFRLTGEVPIRCEDVTIYFSMEEWEYLEEHKDLYNEVLMVVPQPLKSAVLSSKRTTPERGPQRLLPQNCKQENPNVPLDHQVDGEKVS